VDGAHIVGATWGPQDGFLDPLAVAQAYLDEARTAGVRYAPRTPVTGLIRDGGRVRGVITPAGTVPAGRVVLAAGVWGGSVTPGGLPIRPAKRYLYHSHPVRGVDVSGWPLIIADNGSHTRPAEGNTLMFAWESRPSPLREQTTAADLWDGQDAIAPEFGTGPDGYGTGVLEHLSRHLSLFAECLAIARVTCGWYAVTPDHKAILSEDPRSPGLFHAAGFSGHGIMHAGATGQTLADLILERPPKLAPPEQITQHFALSPLLDGRQRHPVEEMVL
jgi:sarcosine oxidase subunit beta